MKPLHQVKNSFASLLGLLALLVAGPVQATEFGVMWDYPRTGERWTDLMRSLRTNGIEWVRIGAGTPVPPFKPSVFWWPAAMPYGSTPSGPMMRLSDDLWSVYWQGRTNAPPQSADATSFEIGNEPDLYFTSDLPDRMAATLKAAWWGLKQGHPERAVLMPSLATAPGPYAEQLLNNGIGRYTDGWNVHFYGWAQDFAGMIRAHRQLLAKSGRADLPLWVTEFGFADLPAGNAVNATLLARQRTFFERVAAEGAALGIAKQWAFMLPSFVEAGLDFGLLTPELEPRPSLQGLLACTRLLHGAEPRYRLVFRATGDCVGYVFRLRAQAGGKSRYATILFSPSRRADFSLPIRRGETSAVDGPASSLFPLKLHFPADLEPVTIGLGSGQQPWSGTDLAVTVSAATNLFLLTPERRFEVADCDWVPLPRSRPLRRLSFHPEVVRDFSRQAAAVPSPVIASLRPLGTDVVADKGALAYRYPTEVPLRFELRWHNFSEQVQRGTWALRLPAGWQLESPAAIAGELTLPPLADSARVLVLRPPAGISSARRDPIALEWRGARGETDQSVLQMAATGPASGPKEAFPPDWQSPGDSTMQWARQETGPNTRLLPTKLAPGTTPGLLLPLHDLRGLAADDVLRLQLRVVEASRPVSLRFELITPHREVFRYGEDQPLGTEWQAFEWRVGDLTPTFWSHVGSGNPTESRYLRLGLFGLAEGQALEMAPLELIRVPASPENKKAPPKRG